MSENAATGLRAVTALFPGGRLTAIPRKTARREQVLVHLSETLFERDRDYSEREVNDACSPCTTTSRRCVATW